MKTTETDCEEWSPITLGDLFSPVTIRAKDLDTIDESVPVLSMTRAHGLVRQSEKFDKRVASSDTAQYKVVRHGELVYGFPIDEGVIAILHRYPRGLVSPAYQVLKPIREFDIEFMDQLLRTPDLIAKYIALSSNVVERRRNLAVRDFLKIEVTIPQVDEQRTIAKIFALVQEAAEQQNRLIQLTTELKKSLMHKLFSEGLRGEPQKETEIGLMPESWTPTPLGDCCDVLSGSISYTDFLNMPTDDTDDAVNCMGVKVSDMNLAGNDRCFDSANVQKRLTLAVAKKKLVPPNAVVFPKRGAAIATNKKRLTTTWTVLDPNLIAVCPKNELDGDFLFYWAQTFDLKTITDPGPTPQLNKKDLTPLLVPIAPDMQEQREIAAAISTVETKINLHRRQQSALSDLFRIILHRLTTAKIRVRDLDLPE